jgi:hypothetical protein
MLMWTSFFIVLVWGTSAKSLSAPFSYVLCKNNNE